MSRRAISDVAHCVHGADTLPESPPWRRKTLRRLRAFVLFTDDDIDFTAFYEELRSFPVFRRVEARDRLVVTPELDDDIVLAPGSDRGLSVAATHDEARAVSGVDRPLPPPSRLTRASGGARSPFARCSRNVTPPDFIGISHRSPPTRLDH
jgi:hypothetical protein